MIKKKPAVPPPAPKPKPPIAAVVEEAPKSPQPQAAPKPPPPQPQAAPKPQAARKAPPPAPPKRMNSHISENGMILLNLFSYKKIVCMPFGFLPKTFAFFFNKLLLYFFY